MSTLALPQHLASLQRANHLRSYRADLRRRLWAGEIRLADVDLTDPDLAGMKLGDLIAACGWHRRKHGDRCPPSSPGRWVTRLLDRQRINPLRLVGNLTDRQRVALVDAMGRECPTQRDHPTQEDQR